MKISTKGRYGFRILLHLALHGSKDHPVNLREIADEQALSEKYIGRLIIELRKAGIVKSVRGAGGGYILNRDPQKLTLLEIVEVMEGKISILGCLANPEICVHANACRARKFWLGINERFRKEFACYTMHMAMSDHTYTNRVLPDCVIDSGRSGRKFPCQGPER